MLNVHRSTSPFSWGDSSTVPQTTTWKYFWMLHSDFPPWFQTHPRYFSLPFLKELHKYSRGWGSSANPWTCFKKGELQGLPFARGSNPDLWSFLCHFPGLITAVQVRLKFTSNASIWLALFTLFSSPNYLTAYFFISKKWSELSHCFGCGGALGFCFDAESSQFLFSAVGLKQ